MKHEDELLDGWTPGPKPEGEPASGAHAVPYEVVVVVAGVRVVHLLGALDRTKIDTLPGLSERTVAVLNALAVESTRVTKVLAQASKRIGNEGAQKVFLTIAHIFNKGTGFLQIGK